MYVRGWQVLQTATVSDVKLKQTLRDALVEPANYGGMPPACFWPGLAFRFGDSEDAPCVVICLKCDQIYIYDSQGVEKQLTFSEQGVARLSKIYDKLFGEEAMRQSESGWASLAGRFVFEGEIPEQRKISITKDAAIPQGPIYDESLVVNNENRGVANVLVYLRRPRSSELRVHPSYAKSALDRVVLRFEKLQLVPHIALLRTSQTLVWKSRDRVSHNQKVDLISNAASGVLLPSGGESERTFSVAERLPVRAVCNIHPWERAYLLIQDHPYMAKSDADGKFEIKNLPAVELEFQFWHERTWYLKDIRWPDYATNAKGRLRLNLPQGDVDLGECKLPAAMFETDKETDD